MLARVAACIPWRIRCTYTDSFVHLSVEVPMFSLRFTIASLLVAATAIAAQAPATKPTLSAATREFVSVDAPIVALTHVKLIDGTGAPAVDDQTVLIQN